MLAAVTDYFEFEAPLWRYDGPAAWYFITLPKELGADIKDAFGGMTGGFGSLRVEVTVGGTTWRTSIFPDTRSASYVLPVKASVRKAESLEAGDTVNLRLRIIL